MPASIGALTKLKELTLASEAELTLPEEIGDLRDLETPMISAPKWNVPARLFELKKINALDLGGSDLRKIPRAIAQLTALESLYLEGAPDLDVGDAMRAIAKLPSLRSLQLGSNRVPKEIGLCKGIASLRIVRYGDAPLVLPNELFDLAALVRLDLGGNRLAELPAAVERLTSLEELSLFDCGVTSLPESLGALPALRILNVSGNLRLKKLPDSVARRKSLVVYR